MWRWGAEIKDMAGHEIENETEEEEEEDKRWIERGGEEP